MRPVEIVTELFMLVLSVIAAPSELKEFRVDLIQQGGRVETLMVHRTDAGFTLLEQQGDQLVEKGSVHPIEGKPSAFALKLGDKPEQIFDFAAGIQGFSVDALKKSQALALKAADGVTIHVHRSGSAVYLTPQGKRVTYACH